MLMVVMPFSPRFSLIRSLTTTIFFERIRNACEYSCLLLDLLTARHIERGLDIISLTPFVHDKIHFKRFPDGASIFVRYPAQPSVDVSIGLCLFSSLCEIFDIYVRNLTQGKVGHIKKLKQRNFYMKNVLFDPGIIQNAGTIFFFSS